MKIAFVSVRGIPNNYGGFEQFAEYISVGLVKRGHEVTVYSPSYHPYKDDEYKGVKIKHIYSPETWMGGSIGSFFYDFMSLKDALKRENFDIIYEAGYTSIIPAFIWFDVKNVTKSIVVTNMDGLEYKRTKFNKWVRKFVFWEERMAVKHSHYLIADNMGIHDYYKEKYGKEKSVKFVGGIYDFNKLNSIRHFSKAYFHGHSVGGTNPSLLEAMASECFILAHDNIFNRAVLKENSLYYPNAEMVTEMLNDIENICTQHKKNFTDGNVEEIKNEYSWEHLVDQHEEYFKWLLEQKKNK